MGLIRLLSPFLVLLSLVAEPADAGWRAQMRRQERQERRMGCQGNACGRRQAACGGGSCQRRGGCSSGVCGQGQQRGCLSGVCGQQGNACGVGGTCGGSAVLSNQFSQPLPAPPTVLPDFSPSVGGTGGGSGTHAATPSPRAITQVRQADVEPAPVPVAEDMRGGPELEPPPRPKARAENKEEPEYLPVPASFTAKSEEGEFPDSTDPALGEDKALKSLGVYPPQDGSNNIHLRISGGYDEKSIMKTVYISKDGKAYHLEVDTAGTKKWIPLDKENELESESIRQLAKWLSENKDLKDQGRYKLFIEKSSSDGIKAKGFEQKPAEEKNAQLSRLALFQGAWQAAAQERRTGNAEAAQAAQKHLAKTGAELIPAATHAFAKSFTDTVLSPVVSPLPLSAQLAIGGLGGVMGVVEDVNSPQLTEPQSDPIAKVAAKSGEKVNYSRIGGLALEKLENARAQEKRLGKLGSLSLQIANDGSVEDVHPIQFKRDGDKWVTVDAECTVTGSCLPRPPRPATDEEKKYLKEAESELRQLASEINSKASHQSEEQLVEPKSALVVTRPQPEAAAKKADHAVAASRASVSPPPAGFPKPTSASAKVPPTGSSGAVEKPVFRLKIRSARGTWCPGCNSLKSYLRNVPKELQIRVDESAQSLHPTDGRIPQYQIVKVYRGQETPLTDTKIGFDDTQVLRFVKALYQMNGLKAQ